MSLKSNRRQFMRALSLTAIAAVVEAPRTQALQQSGTNLPEGFKTKPYLQSLSPYRATIMVLTHQPSYTWIEYGSDELDQKYHAVQDGLVHANDTIFRFRIEDLRPDTTYRYRVVSKVIQSFEPYALEYGEENQSEIFSFTTPPEQGEDVSVLIFNDLHDRPASIDHLFALNKDRRFDFVVFNGDSFDYQTDEQQLVDHLIAPVSALFAQEKPFIVLRGNHETRGKYARQFKRYFDYPQQQYYQAFHQGPVHWTFLDTGEDKADDTAVYAGIVDFDSFRREQATWFEEMAKTESFRQAPFRVVVMHIPPFHSGDWHGPAHCREIFAPLFEKHKVDLVVSGHTHRYGLHQAQAAHPYPVVIGGGPKEGNRTLIRLQATSKELQLSMLLDDGNEVAHLKINSKKTK